MRTSPRRSDAARLPDRGVAHNRAFTWTHTAERTLTLYRQFLEV